MAETSLAGNIRLSPANLKRVRSAEGRIIQSLIDDLDSTEGSVRKEARATLIKLGFTHKESQAKGVVQFLLEEARKGKFGEQAKVFEKSSRKRDDENEEEEENLAEEAEVEEIDDAAFPDDDVDEIDSADESMRDDAIFDEDVRAAPSSKVPLAALDVIDRDEDVGDCVDSFSSFQAKAKVRRKLSSRGRARKNRRKNELPVRTLVGEE